MVGGKEPHQVILVLTLNRTEELILRADFFLWIFPSLKWEVSRFKQINRVESASEFMIFRSIICHHSGWWIKHRLQHVGSHRHLRWLLAFFMVNRAAHLLLKGVRRVQMLDIFFSWLSGELIWNSALVMRTPTDSANRAIGNWTLSRCISYWKWGYSIAMLVFQRAAAACNYVYVI